jgi:hypothetical protein
MSLSIINFVPKDAVVILPGDGHPDHALDTLSLQLSLKNSTHPHFGIFL